MNKRYKYFNLNFYVVYFNNLFLVLIINKGGIKCNKITRGLLCTDMEYNKSADFYKQVHTKLSLSIKKMILKIIEEQGTTPRQCAEN